MTKFSVDDENFAPITIKSNNQRFEDPNNNNGVNNNAGRYENRDQRFQDKYQEANQNDKMRQRKTTLCCLLQKSDNGGYSIGGCTIANKANIFRFVGLCLLTIVILCCVYGLKYGRGSHKHHRSLDSAFSVGDPVNARDLWLIVELQSDSRGRRTHLGKATGAHVCAAIRAAQKIGWTPLLVGGKSRCCRSRCRHLHPVDLPKMKLSTSTHFRLAGEHDMAMRSAAFLSAIKKGAHFIFQANPEFYYQSGISAEEYQQELEYQLRKTTLGISVGLVKEFDEHENHEKEDSIDSKRSKYFNPYSHFARNANDDRSVVKKIDNHATKHSEENIHEYKICEIRPPSIEKFLDSNGLTMDISAPPVTLPGNAKAPFDSRNTAFNRDTFWSLLLLQPEATFDDRGSSYDNLDAYLLRSMIGQALLHSIGGSTKFSVSKIDSSRQSENVVDIMQDKSGIFHEIERYLQNWHCDDSTILKCYQTLTNDLIENGLIIEESRQITDKWIKDLIKVGYRDIENIPDDEETFATGEKSPCIGRDALSGVYYHPAPALGTQLSLSDEDTRITFPEVVDSSEPSDSFSTGTKHPHYSHNNLAAKQIQRLCPSVDTTSLQNKGFDQHEDLLLIVTFYRKEYDSIPLLEILYRPHFKNILYCGEPDETVDKYMRHYHGEQGTYFSFLPAKTKTGYECILGAIEMGYNVEGFLLINQDTLINSWNFKDTDTSKIWHGNEHALDISGENMHDIDPPHGEKIMSSTIGILHAFQFLEDVLLSRKPGSRGRHSRKRTRQGKSLSFDRRSRHKPTSVRAEDLKLAEFILTKPEDRSKRKDNDNTASEEISGEKEDLEYEESEEELAMIMKKDDMNGKSMSMLDDEDEPMSMLDDEESEEAVMEKMDHESAEHAHDSSLMHRNGHISLFGEIVHDEEAIISDSLHPPPVREQSQQNENQNDEDGNDHSNNKDSDNEDEDETANETASDASSSNRNITELLFHPANFDNTEMKMMMRTDQEAVKFAEDMSKMDISGMNATHFHNMMFDIQKIYKKINEKLQTWVRLENMINKRVHSNEEEIDEEIESLREELDELQCDDSTNFEICHLVAEFFSILEGNEKHNHFQLHYDDLPIYYIPSHHKDRLYLMANLFTKYHVADELAFPILLRGLASTEDWFQLQRAELIKPTEKPIINQPQDLLLNILDDRNDQLKEIEAAHYMYPVNMTNEVLKNTALRDVICRNF